ncbi:methylated-DNA--[bacterium]|nr:methylated-DNA--[protein]-cysteine S-methyltransferase [bacterium]
MDYICSYRSPLGVIRLAADSDGLAGLWFEGQKGPDGAVSAASGSAEPPALNLAVRWLDIYFSGGIPDFLPPLSLRGSPFRLAVWELLLQIPYGCTRTYGEIAADLARQRGLAKMSAQAVGGAVGHNPVSLIVPCHRVIGAGGKLVGYAGGVRRKEYLLKLEGAELWR